MTVRMRTIPTEAERAAHNPGPWLCRDEWGNPRVGYWTKLGFESGCQRCLKNTAFAKEVADFFLPFTIGTDSAKN